MNKEFLDKGKEISNNVEDSFVQLKAVTFFKKKTMKIRIRNVRLKKVAFCKTLVGIEDIEIGSSTTNTMIIKKNLQKYTHSSTLTIIFSKLVSNFIKFIFNYTVKHLKIFVNFEKDTEF